VIEKADIGLLCIIANVAKLRVGVIFGGRSGEHEVSVASAAAILQHLDRDRYEPVAVRIEKDGRWRLEDEGPTSLSAAAVITQARLASGTSGHADLTTPDGRDTVMPAHPGPHTLITIDRSAPATPAVVTGLGLDVVFPVLHGPYGEDGTVQGLLELANVAYVGPGVMASAVGMDKTAMKMMFEARGLPVTPWFGFVAAEWARRPDAVTEQALALGLPLFVKPANLGSSVGISKVKTGAELAPAIEAALAFDRKVIVEAGVVDPREIECAVLGNDDPEASVAGEVIPSREFYDYEAKYLDEGSRTIIPADLTAAQLAEVQRVSIAAFRAIDACGMSRVDFLLSRATGALLLNEINTIPGFTTISMFSKLWEASGVPFPALLDRLIQLARDRHQEKQRLRTSAV
jgi:D-alanine-D-alanine ligase